MNDDKATGSVDDLIAKAAQMGRGAGRLRRQGAAADRAEWDVSLAAVASHARKESQPAAPSMALGSIQAGHVPERQTLGEVIQARASGGQLFAASTTQVAAGFTLKSAEFAAVQDDLVKPLGAASAPVLGADPIVRSSNTLDALSVESGPTTAADSHSPNRVHGLCADGVSGSVEAMQPVHDERSSLLAQEKASASPASALLLNLLTRGRGFKHHLSIGVDKRLLETAAFFRGVRERTQASATLASGFADHVRRRTYSMPVKPVVGGVCAVLLCGVLVLVLGRHQSDLDRPDAIASVSVATPAVSASAAIALLPPRSVSEGNLSAMRDQPASSAKAAVIASVADNAEAEVPTNDSSQTVPNAKAANLFGVVTEQSDAGNTALAERLFGGPADGRQANSDVLASGWASALASLTSSSRVAVVRYDALQAARHAPATARMAPLEVLAPLTLEPVYVVARSDSPLQFIHEIEGKTINAGVAGSNLSLTVRTLYRALFDAVLPADAATAQDEVSALDSLVAKKVDVVVLVGSAATPWFTNAMASHPGRFKLLKLDPRHPAGKRALSDFLPVQIGPRGLGDIPTSNTATLGMMAFAVTSQRRASENEAGHDSATTQMAGELCGTRSRSGLSATAGAKRVDPMLQLDVGWPYSSTAQEVFANCRKVGAAVTGAPARAPGSS